MFPQTATHAIAMGKLKRVYVSTRKAIASSETKSQVCMSGGATKLRL